MSATQTKTEQAAPIGDVIAQAIAAAKAAAQVAVAESATAISTAQPANANVPATMPQRGAPLTMGDMTGGLTVDSWLAVSEDGLKAGKDKKLTQDTIKVSIDMTTIQPCFAIKYGKSPVIYKKTYDRMLEVGGTSWTTAVANAQRAEPNAREYRSADIPMTILEDVKDAKGKDTLLEADTTLGYSIPTTGWANYEKFYRACVAKGLHESTVEVILGAEAKSRNGNNWGLVTFTLVA